MTQTVIMEIDSLIQAWRNCIKNHNSLWEERHRQRLEWLEKNVLPSGSGIDCGTKILYDECQPGKRVVLFAEFHHMNETGYYDGWTEHRIVVRPIFSGIDIQIGGRNRNDIKDYLADVYYNVLREAAPNWKEIKACAFE
jgi:hypothetical protein